MWVIFLPYGVTGTFDTKNRKSLECKKDDDDDDLHKKVNYTF